MTRSVTVEAAAPAEAIVPGSSMAPPTTIRISAATDAICSPSGQVNHARSYHGRCAQAWTAASTRGSSVCGARGIGSRRSSPPTRVSRSTGCMIGGQLLSESLAAPMDVGLHFAQRHAEHDGDVLIAHVFEMKEHDGYALVIGEPANRFLQMLVQLSLLHIQP